MALVTGLPSCRAALKPAIIAIRRNFTGCTGFSLHSCNSKEDILFQLATGKVSRSQEMLREFRKAAPDAKTISIRNVAHAIDGHEDFDKPDSLGCVVAEGGLNLYFASPGDEWVVNWKTFGTEVPENQQKTLETAIYEQIDKQKTLFPTRKKVLRVADDHLSQCLKGQNGKPISPEALESQILQLPSPRAQRAQCEDAYLGLYKCFGLFFDALESEGIEVPEAMLECWKPLSLQLATAWYARFRQLEDQLANQTPANATCDEKMQEYLKLQLYYSWQHTKTTFEAS